MSVQVSAFNHRYTGLPRDQVTPRCQISTGCSASPTLGVLPSRDRDIRAFSLIELLVVIAIISILAALLFPVFARAKAAAGDAASISNVKQLGIAIELYLDDNDGIYPLTTDGATGTGVQGGWNYYSVFGGDQAGTFDVTKGSLFPYVHSKDIYKSKADKDAQTSGDSFAFNGYLSPWTNTGLNPSVASTIVPYPAATMLLGEEGCGNGPSFGYQYVNGTNDGYFAPQFDHFAKFHPGGTVVLFCDTHAKILQAEDHFVQTICGTSTQCY